MRQATVADIAEGLVWYVIAAFLCAQRTDVLVVGPPGLALPLRDLLDSYVVSAALDGLRVVMNCCCAAVTGGCKSSLLHSCLYVWRLRAGGNSAPAHWGVICDCLGMWSVCAVIHCGAPCRGSAVVAGSCHALHSLCMRGVWH